DQYDQRHRCRYARRDMDLRRRPEYTATERRNLSIEFDQNAVGAYVHSHSHGNPYTAAFGHTNAYSDGDAVLDTNAHDHADAHLDGDVYTWAYRHSLPIANLHTVTDRDADPSDRDGFAHTHGDTYGDAGHWHADAGVRRFSVPGSCDG